MPVAKKTYKRKYYKKKPIQEKKINQIVKRQLASKMERKVLDYYGSASPDWSGVIVDPLSTISRTVSSNSLVGSYIQPAWSTFSFTITLADTTNIVRMILLSYRVTSPNVSTILESSYLTTTQGVLAPYEKDFKDYYTIIFDRRYTLSANRPVITGTIRYKSKKKIHFLESAATPARDSLFFLFISDSGAVSHPTISYINRLYFYDS